MRISTNQPSPVRATATSQNVFQLRFMGISFGCGIWASRKTAASKRRPAGVVKKAREFSLSLNVSKRTPNQSVVAIIASRFLVGAWILSGSRSKRRPAT